MDASSLSSVFVSYGYFIVFPLSFFLGPLVVVVTGVLASLGYFNPFILFWVLLGGDLTGDILCYFLGRAGGLPFVKRWGKYLGVSKELIDTAGEHFNRHDWKILLFGKTQIAGLPTGLGLLIAAGIFKMPFVSFVLWNAAASAIKVALLEALGFYFGNSFLAVSDSVFLGVSIFFLLLGTLGGLIFIVRKKKPSLGNVNSSHQE